MPLGDKDFNRISENVKKMLQGGADRARIDNYVSAEGVTADEIKTYNMNKQVDEMMQPGAVTTIGQDGTAQTQTKQQFEQGLKPLTPVEKIQAGGESLLKGLTFGGAGFALPAITAAITPEGDKPFKQRFIEQRQKFKERQEKFGKLGTALEIAAGIPSGSAIAGGIRSIGKALLPQAAKGIAKVPALARLLTKVGQTVPAKIATSKAAQVAGAGAGFGGTFGAGEALSTAGIEEGRLPTAAEVKKGFKSGAIAGGIAAPLLAGGVGTAKAAIKLGGKALSPTKTIVARFGKEAIRKAQQMQTSLLESTDPTTSRIALKSAKTAAKLSDEAADLIEKTAKQKLALIPQRLGGKLDELLGGAKLQTTIDDLNAKFTPIKKELYSKAYSTPLDTTKTESLNKLKNILTRPVFKDASKELKKIAATTGEVIPENLADDLNTKNLDLLKRGLDELIEQETDKVTGQLTNLGTKRVELRKEMLSLVDDLNPNFAIARKTASDEFGIKNAIKFGQKALKLSPRQIENEIKNFGDAENEAFLISVKDSLIDKAQNISTSENKDLIGALFKTAKNFKLRQRLMPILGKEKYAKFEKFIEDEIIKNRTLAASASFGTSVLGKPESGVIPQETLGILGFIPRFLGSVARAKTESPFQANIAKILTSPELLKQINVKEATALQKALQGQVGRTTGQFFGTKFGEAGD
jgi:hypothetical protein